MTDNSVKDNIETVETPADADHTPALDETAVPVDDTDATPSEETTDIDVLLSENAPSVDEIDLIDQADPGEPDEPSDESSVDVDALLAEASRELSDTEDGTTEDDDALSDDIENASDENVASEDVPPIAEELPENVEAEADTAATTATHDDIDDTLDSIDNELQSLVAQIDKTPDSTQTEDEATETTLAADQAQPAPSSEETEILSEAIDFEGSFDQAEAQHENMVVTDSETSDAADTVPGSHKQELTDASIDDLTSQMQGLSEEINKINGDSVEPESKATPEDSPASSGDTQERPTDENHAEVETSAEEPTGDSADAEETTSSSEEENVVEDELDAILNNYKNKPSQGSPASNGESDPEPTAAVEESSADTYTGSLRTVVKILTLLDKPFAALNQQTKDMIGIAAVITAILTVIAAALFLLAQ